MNFDDLIDDFELLDNPPTPPNDDVPPIEETTDEEPTKEPVEELPEESPEDDDSKAYFETLKELGALDLPNDYEFKSIEDALSASDKRRTAKIAENLWENLPDDFKPLLEYALNGGKSLEEYLSTFTAPDYETLDLTDENNQRRVLYDYYKNTSSYSDEKIQRMIDRLANSGDLEEEALSTVQDLLEIQQQRKEDLIRNAAEQERLNKERALQQENELKTLIDSDTQIPSDRKNRVKSFMFAPIKQGDMYTTQLAQTMQAVSSNPQHFIQLADILADYNPSKGFNFDRLVKQKNTKDTKNFKALLDQKLDPKQRQQGTHKRALSEDFDWDGFLNS